MFKVTLAEEIVCDINAQLMQLIFDEIDRLSSNTIGFSSLARPMMPSRDMDKLSFPTAVKITSLPQIEATFFGWRCHFQMEASCTTWDEKFLVHFV